MIATPDTVHGTGRGQRVVATGSGFGGLTATKALKHAQVNITDALVFLTRITAKGTSHLVNQRPLWLEVIPASAAVATTIGVLIALHVAVVREPKKAAEVCRHYQAQMDALHRAERQRVAAQARKVVLSCVRTPMFGDSWWTVRIDNATNAVTTILAGDVKAIDSTGSEVPDECRQANNTMPIDHAFDRCIRAGLSASLEGGFQQSPYGGMVAPGASQRLSNQLAPAFKQAMRDALVGHFINEWQRTLPPN